jgi:RHS repeat-associated protein
MTTSNHASAGTRVCGNHANQRAQTSRCRSVRNVNTVTYYLYGLGGERLMEFQETCTSGACTSYTETHRWIYFAGRKIFSKTGTTLKAITPNRLASEAKHFPYGETDGTPPSDTKDYFATYRRDGTGLDYAWNRYYSPTMGRFTTADPGPYSYFDPSRMNLYTYSGSNPVNLYDPTGRSWDDFWGAIVGFFGGGSDSGESSSSATIGNGNDKVAPDEGVVGAEGAGGGSGCTLDQSSGTLIDSQGNVCFDIDAYSDQAIRPEVANALSGVGANAGPVVEGLAVATVGVPAFAYGTTALISLATPTFVATTGSAGTAITAASQTPTGQNAVSGLLWAAQGGANWTGHIVGSMTQSTTTMYRVWGGGSGQVGQWLTPTMPSSSAQTIANLSLPSTNSATFVSEVVVPAGTTIQSGIAAPLFGQVGGGMQVLLLQTIPSANFGPGVPLP